MLIAGTNDGVYVFETSNLNGSEKVLESGRCMRVRSFDSFGGAFSATKSGLYISKDDAMTWENLGVPEEEVYSVVVDSKGERLYAGTHPAHLYVVDLEELEEGDLNWNELRGFQRLPSRGEWHTPRHRNEAHVRSLGVHKDSPDRLIAGVEVGGVFLSDDRGESWVERKQDVHIDVHHVLIVGKDEYVASCGAGLYRTKDAGESWTRLDRNLNQTYFRESYLHDGTLFAAGSGGPPPSWKKGAEAAIFESDDMGESFEVVDYPCGPEEVVLAWTSENGCTVAGTNKGTILVRESDGWVDVGSLPSEIRSLCAV